MRSNNAEGRGTNNARDDAQMRIAIMRSMVQLSGSGSIIAQRGSTSGSQKHAGFDGSYGLVIDVPHSSKSSIISHAATSAAGDLCGVRE